MRACACAVRRPWGRSVWSLVGERVRTVRARLRDAYLAHAAEPHRARAPLRRWWTAARGHPRARVHGGPWAVEERAWPIPGSTSAGSTWRSPSLPFHGVRARTEGGAPPFPGADPRFTNEGFRQAVADLRVLIAVLRERGATSVGMMGMSLGGYTTALMATLEEAWRSPCPSSRSRRWPTSRATRAVRPRGRGDREQHGLEAANRVVSPFARPGRVAPERVLVVGAEADQVTPIAHADASPPISRAPLLRVDGGHLCRRGGRRLSAP